MEKGYTIKENQALVKELDHHFQSIYIPNIQELSENLDVGCEIVPEITSIHGQTLERQLTVLLHANVFTRFNVQLSINSWMVCVDTFMVIDGDFDFNRIKPLLSNSRYEGCPPELNYDFGGKDYTVKFSNGYGEGGGFRLEYHGGALERIENIMKMHRKLDEFFIYGLDEDNVHNLIEIMFEVYEAN